MRMRHPSPYVHQPDREVVRAVEDALLMDPRVNAANPTVSVTNGAVTLSGVVDTLYAKQAAQEDALNTTGVWKVDNQLQLRYRAFPTDDEIEHMIRDVLSRDAELYDQPIQVAVDDNHVTMAGSVQTEGQKVRATNIISQVDGVLTLDNRIRAAAGTDGDDSGDAEISAAVSEQLFWSPYVYSDAITVTVTDGRVDLKGKAANRFVGRIAVSNAFEGGARSVHTRLRLDSGGIMAEHFTSAPTLSGPLGPAAVLKLWR
jgi:osmotically-inducible protein OsmY